MIWGEGTNACASDSKHFGAWHQNLTTQWHVRTGRLYALMLTAGQVHDVHGGRT